MDLEDRGQTMSISEAVETLSEIVDWEVERLPSRTPSEGLGKKGYRIEQLQREGKEGAVALAKDTFSVVLHYLYEFFKKKPIHVSSHRSIERVKTIMLLVGEAAKNLDKYTALFQKSTSHEITSLGEYQKLQEFYKSRISRRVDERALSRWVWAIAKGTANLTSELQLVGKDKLPESHLFVDLESVKKDTEYELFFMRKASGARFFNPRLIRNMKLVCDFEEVFGEKRLKDPLEGVRVWEDENAHIAARSILKVVGPLMDPFFRGAYRHKRMEIVPLINNMFTALYLSSYTHNLLAHAPVKSCEEYFIDFQYFFRKVLRASEYQKWVTYPPKRSHRFAHLLLDIVHSIAAGLFLYVKPNSHLVEEVNSLVDEAKSSFSEEHLEEARKNDGWWNGIACEYAAMRKLARSHGNGPLEKVLELLDSGVHQSFDPIVQRNIPFQLFSLFVQRKKITNVRIPSPTKQEQVNRATIIDEWRAMQRWNGSHRRHNKHLLINLQDSTSWREHARSAVLEELPGCEGFEKSLIVVTLNKDTDFYWQRSPYAEVNQTEQFLQQFKEHLVGQRSGYFFPANLRKKIFSTFVPAVFKQIHQIFFGERNVLTTEGRKDFIEIFYLFLEMKLIDCIQPTTFSLTCMDGVDRALPSSVLLFLFLKHLEGADLPKAEKEYLNYLLYATSILLRGRLIHEERMKRMISALRRLEGVCSDMGKEAFVKRIQKGFGSLFDTDILEGHSTIPEILT